VCVMLVAGLKYQRSLESLDSENGRRYDSQKQTLPPASIILVTKVAGRSTRLSSFKFCRKNKLRVLCLTYNKLPKYFILVKGADTSVQPEYCVPYCEKCSFGIQSRSTLLQTLIEVLSRPHCFPHLYLHHCRAVDV
jgi:hypothetical protein